MIILLLLMLTVNQIEQSIGEQKETVQMKEQDIASLEAKVQEVNQRSKNSKAKLYFA